MILCDSGLKPHLEERGPCGVLKQGTPRGLRFLKACSISLPSEDGSILQNEPLPGSSCDRATLMKYRFSDRLWRIEFCDRRNKKKFIIRVLKRLSLCLSRKTALRFGCRGSSAGLLYMYNVYVKMSSNRRTRGQNVPASPCLQSCSRGSSLWCDCRFHLVWAACP